jgi:hypothetical protein
MSADVVILINFLAMRTKVIAYIKIMMNYIMTDDARDWIHPRICCTFFYS